eukprot:g39.t1
MTVEEITVSEAALVGRANMIRPEDIACTTAAQEKHLAAFQAGSKDWLSYRHETEDPAEIRAAEDFLRHVLCILLEQVLGQRRAVARAEESTDASEKVAELETAAKRAIGFVQNFCTSTTPASSTTASPHNGDLSSESEEQEDAVDHAAHLVVDAQIVLRDFLNHVSEKDWDDAVRQARRFFQCAPTKGRLVKTLSELVHNGVLPKGTAVERILKKKSVRSNSGVVVITVVTAPGKFSCPHDCYYCPDEPGQPRSYLSTEPAVQRANQNDFDPVKQFYDRAVTLAKQGHEVDKVEIIVLGGTWSAYDKTYQDQFCRDLFFAANTFCNEDDLRRGVSKLADLADGVGMRKRLDLVEEQRLNEVSECKIIGLTLETRPDHITKAEVKRLRLLGCTRVQIGVQHTDDAILKKVNRGHTTQRAVKAVQLLKTAGFKVDIHLMPDLPGSTPEKDWEMFRYVLNSDALQADHWKIYPCEVTPFTTIEKWHTEGLYKPYTDTEPDTMIRLLCNVKVNVHPWIRLNRVIRDIPEVSIIAGNQNTNLRQVLFDQLSKCGESCKCTRCREVRRYGEPLDQLFVRVRKYRSSGGWEYFLSVEGADRGLGGGAEKRSGAMSRKEKKKAAKMQLKSTGRGGGDVAGAGKMGKGKGKAAGKNVDKAGKGEGNDRQEKAATIGELEDELAFDLFGDGADGAQAQPVVAANPATALGGTGRESQRRTGAHSPTQQVPAEVPEMKIQIWLPQLQQERQPWTKAAPPATASALPPNRDNGALYGLLRLRMNDDPSAVREIFPELDGAALIRELHVYGEVRPVYREEDKEKKRGVTLNDDPTVVEEDVPDDEDAAAEEPSYYRRKAVDPSTASSGGKTGTAQHGGIGKLLMCVAETIAERHGSEKISVISGVGVRNYYRKLGYEQKGLGRVEAAGTGRPEAGAEGAARTLKSSEKAFASAPADELDLSKFAQFSAAAEKGRKRAEQPARSSVVASEAHAASAGAGTGTEGAEGAEVASAKEKSGSATRTTKVRSSAADGDESTPRTKPPGPNLAKKIPTSGGRGRAETRPLPPSPQVPSLVLYVCLALCVAAVVGSVTWCCCVCRDIARKDKMIRDQQRYYLKSEIIEGEEEEEKLIEDQEEQEDNTSRPEPGTLPEDQAFGRDQEGAHGDECCFRIGYGAMMKPCCLKILPNCDGVTESEHIVGGDVGRAETCPATADAAADAIKEKKKSGQQGEKAKGNVDAGEGPGKDGHHGKNGHQGEEEKEELIKDQEKKPIIIDQEKKSGQHGGEKAKGNHVNVGKQEPGNKFGHHAGKKNNDPDHSFLATTHNHLRSEQEQRTHEEEQPPNKKHVHPGAVPAARPAVPLLARARGRVLPSSSSAELSSK